MSRKGNRLHRRRLSEGVCPLVDITGSVEEAGRSLGHVWREALKNSASRSAESLKPWWTCQPYRKLVSKYAPYLPVLMEGMARAAEVPPWAAGADVKLSQLQDNNGGCTSFAIAPAATLDGIPISGQTKDTHISRAHQYQILRLRLTDAPSHLTATYAGWLFGHGFIAGGCAIFRNSLHTPHPTHGLAYPLFGLLALHCPSVEDVARIARDHGVRESVHVLAADEHGGILGLEITHSGVHILKPRKGIYTHANCVLASKNDLREERPIEHFSRDNSLCRTGRLRQLLLANAPGLTAQQAMHVLADGVYEADGISRNTTDDAMTTAAIVVQPTRRMLHITRGNPAQNWPTTYQL